LSEKAVNILVLVSGNGSNLQALIDAEKSGGLEGGRIAAVLSDMPGVYALKRAEQAGIPVFTEEPDKSLPIHERRADLSKRILKICEKNTIGLIIYAGFMRILEKGVIDSYAGRMINVHPALLPKFGGKGMYGEHVHKAVLAAGEKESGCTVHIVTAGVDAGPILVQRKVPVLPGDSPETLADRIHPEEHIAIVEAAQMMIERLV